MKKFKGLHVPNCAPMTEVPKESTYCHVIGGEHCEGILCDECVFSTENHKERLEYYNHLKSEKMEFDKEENVLKIGDKVYDVVERKVEYKKGVWYRVMNPNRTDSKFTISRFIKLDNRGLFTTDATICIDGELAEPRSEYGYIYSKCFFTEATTEDFLHLGYRLLKTKQPWDGKMQEFLVKDREVVIAFDNDDSFEIVLSLFDLKTSGHLQFEGGIIRCDNYLPATPENIDKMSEWMKRNLK